MARPVDRHPDQKVPGEVQPLGIPALVACDLEIEQRQRHRQALAALDDLHEVGVLQVVVGRAVAAIGEGLGDHFGQRLGHGAAPMHEVGDRGRHLRHVLAERHEVDRLFVLQQAQGQRHLDDLQTHAVARTEVLEAGKRL